MKWLMQALICLLISVPVWGQLSVYPSNWWVGMKDPSLQLMLHRDGIGKGKVSVDPYPGVKLIKTYVPENKNYLFIDLSIAPGTKPGRVRISIRDGKYIEVFSYELKARNAGNGKQRVKGVHSSDLVYLIMPDRFSNGDPANDVVNTMRDKELQRDNPFSRHGGDLKGIENRLDYLKDLGVTALWMTPVLENDMPRMNEWNNMVAGYHGYWFTDHYTVDQRLGGDQAYRSLINAAHAKGLKVIQDAVYNHVGNHHWFILDQPMKDWINNWPAYQGANHKEEVFYDPHVARDDKDIMVGGWFVPHLPDLNLRNPWLAKFLIQHAIWTTEEFGIDGWRVDTYKYCDEQFMNNVNAALEREFPSITIFGEAWCNTPVGSAYFVKNNLNVPFKHNLQGVTDFPIAYGIKDAATGEVAKLYSLLSQDFLYKDPGKNCIFLENHDMDRILSVLGADVSRLKIATGMLLTLRGIPQVYYGTEVLMKNFKVPSDAEVRRDFPGGWVGDSTNKFTPAGRTAAEQDFFNYFRTIARYRQRSTALQKGELLQYQPSQKENVYVYFRYSGSQRVMCIVNPNTENRELDLSRFREGLAGRTAGKDVITGNTVTLTGKLTIGAKAFMMVDIQ